MTNVCNFGKVTFANSSAPVKDVAWNKFGSTVLESGGLLLITMFTRPGKGRLLSGMDSQVRRPIITTFPSVISRNRLRSAGMCQGIAPFCPIPPYRSHATITLAMPFVAST